VGEDPWGEESEDPWIEATYVLILEPSRLVNACNRRIGVALMAEEPSEERGWEMKTITII
jgi:hypothetical protein